MAERLVLVGAGGLGRETAQAALAAGVPVAGFLDDAPGLAGGKVGEVPVLGSTADAAGLDADARVLATVASSADPGRRLRLVARLALTDDRWGLLVHPSAQLAASTEIGPGCVVLAGCVTTADVVVGRHVVLMPACVLTHDDVVEDGVTFASGVRLSGGVRIGRGAYLGTGAMVR